MRIDHAHPFRELRRVTAVLALATLVLAGGSGCASGGDAGTGQAPTVTQPDATATAEPTSTTSGMTAAPSASGSASPSSTGSAQTATALQAIATAENEVQGGKVFDLEHEANGGQRTWVATVAASDGRQTTLSIAQDGSSVIRKAEDKIAADDRRRLKSAEVDIEAAINTAADRAKGKGDLTSLELDTDDDNTVIWQIEFGGDDGTTVLLDATSGEVLDVGVDVG